MYHMMGYHHGMYYGGGWIWETIGILVAIALVLVIILLLVVIKKHTKKEP